MNKQENPNEFVNVASFDRNADAESLKSLFGLEGIETRIKDETNLQRYWFFVRPKAAFHVQVHKENFGAAQALLTEPRMLPYLRNAITCPSCESHRVQYPAITRKNLLPTVVTRVLVLLQITPHKYYCEDCHYTWADKLVRQAPVPKSTFKSWPLEKK